MCKHRLKEHAVNITPWRSKCHTPSFWAWRCLSWGRCCPQIASGQDPHLRLPPLMSAHAAFSRWRRTTTPGRRPKSAKHTEQELREYIDLLGVLVGRQQQAQVFDQLATGRRRIESEGRTRGRALLQHAVSLSGRTNAAAPLQAACRLNWLRVGQIACGDAYSSVRNGMGPLIAELQRASGQVERSRRRV